MSQCFRLFAGLVAATCVSISTSAIGRAEGRFISEGKFNVIGRFAGDAYRGPRVDLDAGKVRNCPNPKSPLSSCSPAKPKSPYDFMFTVIDTGQMSIIALQPWVDARIDGELTAVRAEIKALGKRLDEADASQQKALKDFAKQVLDRFAQMPLETVKDKRAYPLLRDRIVADVLAELEKKGK
ncbi:hypothetical protein [Mesorhizobium sp. M6A.T.Ce.TU.016.01.1.1]|uniref:hypothetical protein n=1 Tax=Mesorhizobium sp. M6A.T.Ce.TU.016.01.1.1 TaxID=2496783 RepID=UPI000FC9FDD8|nr:hypothetical protein [Mesorhizobium sp. M6A.T.Ce.TU.016.01.1.1]RUU30391.1 hypothetical protein EOC94_10880 [Mesorhizobium sp. M6A.T.Ce.TU.016.01.1.1]